MHAGARRRFVVPPELGKSGPCIGFPCFTFSSEGKGGGTENQRERKHFSHTHTHMPRARSCAHFPRQNWCIELSHSRNQATVRVSATTNLGPFLPAGANGELWTATGASHSSLKSRCWLAPRLWRARCFVFYFCMYFVYLVGLR